MRHSIEMAVEDAIRAAKQLSLPSSLEFIEKASLWISECFKQEGKLLIAGNGGSLCDAMHFAEEFTGYFRDKRKALPAITLSDPGHLTCVANDKGFEDVFSRGVEALGRPEDLLILLTTSGNSQNLINAAFAAKEKKMRTIAFLGKTGGRLREMCDLEWVVSGFNYSDRIQEAHMAAIHIIIEMVEKQLFSKEPQISSCSSCH